jgi:hypothetical protein
VMWLRPLERPTRPLVDPPLLPDELEPLDAPEELEPLVVELPVVVWWLAGFGVATVPGLSLTVPVVDVAGEPAYVSDASQPNPAVATSPATAIIVVRSARS